MEVSLDRLLVTQPSHFTPQKVRGFLVGFNWLQEAETIIKKILLTSWAVKVKIIRPNCPHFPVRNADFGLEYCILKEDA
jgi:hypothetical protein